MFSKYRCVSACVAVMLLASVSTARASGFTFHPNPLTYPDITADASSIDYNSGSGLLTVCGQAYELRPNSVDVQDVSLSGSPLPCAGGNYFLSAHISSAGIFTGGTLTITGGVSELGIPIIADATKLLTATLTDFSFVPAGHGAFAIFRFLAAVTSSQPGTGFGPFAGAEIITNDVKATNFLNSFSGGTGMVDTFGQVPEPASLTLLGAGLALLLRRRMSHKKTLARRERNELRSQILP